MISYDNLWKTMKDKGITQYVLIKQYNVSPGQITRLKRNESVSTHTIEMFCRILKCKVEDIMEYIPDEDQNERIHSNPFLFPPRRKKAPNSFEFEAFGGDNRDRTGDLLNAIQALSQLSYTPTRLLGYISKNGLACQQ